jgi:N-glycosylase/DNA lyase
VDAYDLQGTLDGGQAFGWEPHGDAWHGVVQGRWIELRRESMRIEARGAVPIEDWGFLERYLGIHEDLGAMIATFPDDPPLRAAVSSCPGLRLLRQDPWEALACFLCSATKQVVQIQEIVRLLRQRHGEPIPAPPAHAAWTFPSPERLASLSEEHLRACKLGFRSPHLLAAARALALADSLLLPSLPAGAAASARRTARADCALARTHHADKHDRTCAQPPAQGRSRVSRHGRDDKRIV